MYTVVRFSHPASAEPLHTFAQQLDLAAPGLFTGMDRVPNRFSCTVASGGDWEVHRRAVLELFSGHHALLEAAAGSGISVCIDVAIDPEDYASRLFAQVGVDPELAEWLVRSGVSLLFTVYPMGDGQPCED